MSRAARLRSTGGSIEPLRVDVGSGLMLFNVAIPNETWSREQMVANGAYTAERADKAVAEGYIGDGSQR